jgi:hypothetical protein
MGKSVHKPRTRLGIEVLESRNLMAGDVSVTVSGGDLLIAGDALDNQVRIDQSGLAANEFRVSGERLTGINGDAVPVVVSGVTGGVFIRLGQNRDKVTFDGGQIPGDLRIISGGGADAVILDGTTVGGQLHIETGAGPDSVHLLGVEVGDLARIATGVGADVVTRENSVFHGVSLASTGAGNDTVLTRQSTFEQTDMVRTGGGDNLETRRALSRVFDFRNGARGWKAGFADFDPDVHDIDAESGIRELPAELGPGTGFFLAGSNVSDDLFMFLKRRLKASDGIKPNRRTRSA